MPKIYLILGVFFLVAGWAKPSYADLDQLCLKQCVAAGNGANACMSNCSYGVDATAAAPVPPSSHHVFSPLLPQQEDTVIVKQKPVKVAPEKDYTCFVPCLQAGNAYQLCEQRCAKQPSCATAPAAATARGSTTSCADVTVTGVLNGSAINR